MLKVYVFTLILGAGLTVLSFVSDMFDVDADMDVDGDAGVGEASFGKLLATYGMLYFCLGFGAAGTFLSLVTPVSAAMALGGAVATGSVSGMAAARLLYWLKNSDTGHRLGDDSWGGTFGTVVVPITAASPGEVRVTRGHRDTRLRAVPHASWAEGDGEDVRPDDWTSVMVVEVKNGIAFVVPDEGTTKRISD